MTTTNWKRPKAEADFEITEGDIELPLKKLKEVYLKHLTKISNRVPEERVVRFRNQDRVVGRLTPKFVHTAAYYLSAIENIDNLLVPEVRESEVLDVQEVTNVQES